MRIEMELRNLPRHRIVEYLTEVGGWAGHGPVIQGSGWSAHPEKMEAAQVGVLSIPRDRLVIEGEIEAVQAVHAFMRRKTMRGGG